MNCFKHRLKTYFQRCFVRITFYMGWKGYIYNTKFFCGKRRVLSAWIKIWFVFKSKLYFLYATFFFCINSSWQLFSTPHWQLNYRVFSKRRWHLQAFVLRVLITRPLYKNMRKTAKIKSNKKLENAQNDIPLCTSTPPHNPTPLSPL